LIQCCNKSRGGFDTVELLGSGVLAHENVLHLYFSLVVPT
jgi:hypothetical protein